MRIDKYRLPFRLYNGWYSLNKSLTELDAMRRFGSLSEIEYRWRFLFWAWSAPRMHGKAGKLQDRCYKVFGLDGIDRRIARVAKLRERYIRARYGQWLVE